MRIEELTTGLNITFLIRINGEEMTFDSKILEVYPRKHIVLAEGVYRDNKIISFRGKNLIVDLLVALPDDKPQLFKNITVTVVKKADNTLCYNLATLAESKAYNRRGSYRCYVGIPSSVQCGTNRAAYDAIIRDVSSSGFSVVCSDEVSLKQNQVIHALLNDYIEETAENYSFHLYGLIARIQELENGSLLYGCRLNNSLPGLEGYIMKKERIRLKKTNGGNL